MKPTGFLYGIGAVLAATLLQSCAVGPNFKPPSAPDGALPPHPAATVQAGGQAQVFTLSGDISGDWWALYHSPELNALIDNALKHNANLAESQATLLAAEENVREAYGVLSPTVTGSLQDERQLDSTASQAAFGGDGGGRLKPFTLYDASLSVSYSLDLWGGARREIESLKAQQEYERYQLEAAYLTLTSNIVTAAVTEASLRAQIDDTNAIIAAEQHELNILNTQFSLGGVAKANVLSEQATLAQSLATLPPLQSQLAQTRNQLAAYAGAFPGNFHEADFTLADLHLPLVLPVSLPSAILAQRPDIAAAAAQLHEESANLGVADAQMLPQINLSAGVGQEALTPGALFSPGTLLWSLVAGLSQPIFEGGELAAKRKIALYNLQGAGAAYQNTVIGAFQNVADALSALQYDALTLNAAQAAADAANASLAVTQNAYTLGGEPFTAVLTAQTTAQSAQINLVKAQAARLTDTAALYQALGGGWWHRQDVTTACCGIIP
jgi:NodT family efflux transporter outer membrane factor (OMF) lipoprotein